ncbi:serine hydrolase domain-containing protein [Butyrivibrio sp. FCS014]|uniref:serine hydrolase domain-containing protein n=1 Tax=Butyrivibrio sp. FCS014 TaxID=1408304 RepID=UPI00046510E8|nr:serine hydrolase [Butyrivibrio sp. FCS014]
MFTFEKAQPSKVGIADDAPERIIRDLNASPVTLHNLLIMKDDRLIFEKYYAPYDENNLHRMFSISKSFTAMGISLLADDGLIDLDRSVCDYFPEYVDENTHPFIRMTTIRNMLQMRSPHASTTYKVCMKTDWVESFFKVTPTHKPGTVFHYDTSAAHVLCALVEKLSGKDLLTFLKDRALHYVDFSKESYMVKDPFGVSMGGSGLMATPMDIMKFLFILYKKGTIVCSDGKERTLFNPDFIAEATRNITDTYMTAPVSSEAQGYGMQIWMNQKGGFTLYGMGGQLGICIPSENLLIVTTADTQGLQGGNQIIYDAIYKNLIDDKKEMPEQKCGEESSGDYGGDSYAIGSPKLPESYRLFFPEFDPEKIPEYVRGIAGSRSLTLKYSLAENGSGFEGLTLCLAPNGSGQSYIEFKQGNSGHRIAFGIGSMVRGIFPIYETRYVAGAVFTRDNVLYIKAHLIGESVGSVHFQLYFGDNDIVVFMKKIEETFFKEFEGHLYGSLI